MKKTEAELQMKNWGGVLWSQLSEKERDQVAARFVRCVYARTNKNVTDSQHILQLFNDIILPTAIPPQQWKQSIITVIYKSGDSSLPSNYRPISLLAVGYKALASMLHQRLLDGGCERRMRESQFGCRPKRGPSDALVLVRRMVDAAHMNNGEAYCFSY